MSTIFVRSVIVFVSSGLVAAALFALPALAGDGAPAAKAKRVAQAQIDRIPTADLGNGYYRNPVLVGPGADNSVIRVDKDFCMTVGVT